MIKAKSGNGYVDVEISGNGRDIARELCSILNNMCQTEETQLLVIAAINDHISHLQKSK